MSDEVGLSRLFYPERTSCSFPLEVDTLDVRLPNLRANPGGQEDNFSAELAHSIYRLFSPIHAALASASVPDVDPLIVYLDGAPWSRLRTISLDQIDWAGHLSELAFFSKLPSGSLTVTVDLAKEPELAGYLTYLFVGQLCPRSEDDATKELLSSSWPQVKEVVVKVNSDQQRQLTVDHLHDDWDERFDLSLEERDRREAMIRYVVV